MNISEILKICQENDIQLSSKDNKLRAISKSKTIPAHIGKILKENKNDIVEFLTGVAVDNHTITRLADKDRLNVPLSFSQQRLWFLSQFIGPSAVYNIPLAIRLKGKLDFNLLQKCLTEIVNRHESLRTRFKSYNGTAIQIIDPPILDLNAEKVESVEELKQICLDERNYLFNLSEDKLCRIRLLKDIPSKSFVLLITMHHAIADGWSTTIFFDELVALYSSYKNHKSSPLEALDVQFIDYTKWQHEWLKGERLESQLDYWRMQLDKLPSLLSLPTDKIRPLEQQFRGSVETIEIPLKLTKRLHQISQDSGVTLYVTLLSCFALLLSRYSGQFDIAIGTPIANRVRKETEKLIGFFANTLVMRIDLSNNPSFSTLLKRTHEVTLQAFAHQDIPFEKLVDELNPERSVSHSPLFQVMFSLQNIPLSSVSLPGLEISSMEQDRQQGDAGVSRFDLTFNMVETAEGLSAHMEYDIDLFEQSTIKRMLRHFNNIITKIVEFPNQVISKLELLSEKDIRQLKYTWNDNQNDFNRNNCLHDLFQQQVVESPDSIALIDNFEHLTFQQVNERANQLAHYLLETNICTETAVGICLSRSTEIIIAMLGILKSGGFYIPLDPNYPKDRLSYLIKDSGVELIVSKAKLLNSIELTANLNRKIKCIDLATDIRDYDINNPTNRACASNLAYLIYTSGSTGNPKGVGISHCSVTALINWASKLLNDDEYRCVLASTSICFDISVYEIFFPLCMGKECLVIDDVLAFNEVPQQARVSLINTVPSAAKALLENNAIPKSVLIMSLVGEPLKASLVDLLYNNTQVKKVIDNYGPTEDTIFSTFFLREKSGIETIGKPIDNTQAYVLDKDTNMLPIGVVGELCLAGEGVARGYFNQPAKTAERFIPNPYASNSASRLYRTGDLVRYLSSGNLEYLGRTDYQVKIRGFRIELGEIESVMLEHPSIRDAVVLVREDLVDVKKLVAYVVPDKGYNDASIGDTGNAQLSGELASFLQSRLPAYMVPDNFLILDKLPLTANGKIDRSSLPSPVLNTHKSYQKPKSLIEKYLCEIWKSVLQIEQIGVTDNFFAVGGDSILSIQIVSRAKTIGLAIRVRQIFKYPTIESLSKQIDFDESVISQNDSVGEMKLLPIHRQLCFNRAPNPNYYLQSQLLSVAEHFSLEFLQKFVIALYHRHDSLRLYFTQKNNRWSANFKPLNEQTLERSVEVVNLQNQSMQSRKTIMQEKGQQIRTSFELTNGPLVKMIYFKASDPVDSRLLLVFHHLAIDGVSWRIILDDLNLAYNQWCEQKPLRLANKTTSYQHWSAQLESYRHVVDTPEIQSFWQAQLRSEEYALSEYQTSNIKDTFATCDYFNIELTQLETKLLLQDCNHAYHTQTKDLLITALVLAVSSCTGKNTIRLDLEGHGREEDLFDNIDLSETVGWFTTLFPLSIDLIKHSQATDNENILAELIISIKDKLRRIPDRGISYGLLQNNSNQAHQSGYLNSPILFNYLGQFDTQLGKGSNFQAAEEITGYDVDSNYPRSHLIGFTGHVKNNQLRFVIDFSSARLDKEFVKEVSNTYQETLKDIIQHCQDKDIARFTASDFPLTQVTQSTIDRLQVKFPHLEDIYPASGMQSGLVFHSLLNDYEVSDQIEKSNPTAEDKADIYANQLILDFNGEFESKLFKEAWQYIVARHSIFRTAFVSHSNGSLLQILSKSSHLDWYEEDISNNTQQQQKEIFENFRQQDKQLQFDFEQAPLMRMSLFKLGKGKYRWLWTHHHSLLDGWSIPVVLSELFITYDRIANLKSINLSKPEPYRNYINWLESQDSQVAKEFWQKELSGINNSFCLHIDNLPVQSTFVKQVKRRFEISVEITQALNTLAKQHSVTLNSLILVAWSYLLYRYSGESRVVFGQSVSGRPAAINDIQHMVGIFINTLPVQLEIKPETSFSECLHGLNQSQGQREEFGYLSFAEIQACSDIPAGRKLFDTLLTFENYPVESVLDDRNSELDYQSSFEITDIVANDATDYSIALNIQAGHKLNMRLSYSTENYAEETIERLVKHIQVILKGFVNHQFERIIDYPYLDDFESQNLALTWNNTKFDFPQHQLVHQLFERHAQGTPDKVAVSFNTPHGFPSQITYKQLDERSSQLANYLIKQSIGPDVAVGVCVERSIEMAIGILAILKAGGCYLPLDPEYPTSRLEYMLNQSNCDLVLSDSDLIEQLPFLSTVKTLPLNSDYFQSIVAKESTKITTDQVDAISPHTLAYTIYTSGSTGEPKASGITHQNILRLIFNQFFDYSNERSIMCAASISFDAFTFEFWGALLHGGHSILVDPKVFGYQDISEVLNKYKIDTAWLTSALFNQIVSQSTQQLKQLKYLVVGGDALSIEHIRQALKSLPNTQLINGYGPTENTTFSCTFNIKPDNLNDRASVPIGKPIGNSSAYVLDQHGQKANIGIVGELYLAGAGLSRGYLNQPVLTAEKFIPNPFTAKIGDRMYRTGDLVRYLADGNIEFIGRVDHQVKVRGFRIELSEIEIALLQHENVSETLVTIKEDNNNEKQIIAYIVVNNRTNEDQNIIKRLLIDYLKSNIPDYMIPAAFVMLEKMPLNQNGKIDRDSLPVVDESAFTRTAYVAPKNGIEEKLVQLWQSNLGVESISTEDNYFSLGGDSIRSISLVAESKKQGIEFSVKDLFSHATITSLAQNVKVNSEGQFDSEQAQSKKKNEKNVKPFSLITKEQKEKVFEIYQSSEIEDIYPMSSLQQGMVFHSIRNPSLSTYHDIMFYRIDCQWDPLVFTQSLDYLINKHAILRTIFCINSSNPIQIVFKQQSATLKCIDLISFNEQTQRDELDNWLREERDKGINITESPWRVFVHLISESQIQLGLSFHHALLDGWSVANFVTELCEIYALAESGKQLPLIQTPPSYGYFIANEKTAIESEQHKQHWRTQFKDAKLPWWSGEKNQNNHDIYCEVAKQASGDIIALASSLKVQEKSIWCAIYLTLIALLDGSDEVVGSVVTHGRPEISDSEKTLGLFLNSLPIKVNASDFDVNWSTFIKDVDKSLKGLHELRFYPLIEIQNLTGLNFSASLFNFINFHVYDDQASQKIVAGGGFEENNYRLAFNVLKDENLKQHRIRISLDSSIFDNDFQNRIQSYVQNICDHLRSDSNQIIDKKLLISQQELQALELGMASTKQNLGDDFQSLPSIQCLFENNALTSPHAIAAVFNPGEGRVKQVSYGELNRRANHLAYYLINQGVNTGLRVGICIDRSLDMLVTLLAVLKTGGVYVPLDPEYPTKRLSYIVKDSDIKIIVTHSIVTERLNFTEIINKQSHSKNTRAPQLIVIDQLERKIWSNENTASNLDNNITPKNNAYLLYTSGSTGAPKGVMISHANAINFLLSMQKRPGIQSHHRLLAVTTLSFDIAFLELVLPISTGATVVIADRQTTMDGKILIDTIKNHYIEILQATPATWKLLVDSNWSGSKKCIALVGGEAFPQKLAKQLNEKVAKIWNMYGPTETTVWSSAYLCKNNVKLKSQYISIGRPIDRTQIYLLDKQKSPVITGAPGEIYIGGNGVAQGYFNKPMLTAENFIPNPFVKNQGDRMYRTGDLARITATGELEYLGRIDHQIKIRGYRIELGEIENVLINHEKVKDAIVHTHRNSVDEQQLVAYVITNKKQQSDAKEFIDDLISYSRKLLPNYMLPTAVIVLDVFPMTANGKIDRSSLPGPMLVNSQFEFVSPEGVTEELLANMWRELLNYESISRTHNFFTLGGHSLLITQLLSRIREVFKIELPIKDLFEYQTLQSQASRIECVKKNTSLEISPVIPSIPVVDRSKTLRLSFAQQRLWFLNQYMGPNAVYNMPLALRINGKLDCNILIKSIKEIINRHESLRTRFSLVDKEIVQVISPSTSEIAVENISDEEELKSIYYQERNFLFNLSSDSLCRVRVLNKQSENIHILLVTMHHSISDGWSLAVFFKELVSLYQSFTNHQPSSLKPLKIQYADYAQWQRQWLQGEVLLKQLDYWRKQLSGSSPLLTLPTDRPRPIQQTYRGGMQEFSLSQTLSNHLQNLSRSHGVTLFMSLLAAYALLLARYAGQEDISIGTPIANRTRKETESLIGFFVNTLVMRCDLSDDPSFIDLLKQVREVALQAYAHQDIPFEQLVEELNPERSQSYSPLFQAMFALQNIPVDSAKISDIEFSSLNFAESVEDKSQEGVSRYDLWLFLHETPQGLVGAMEYNADLFDRATIVRMIEHYQHLLESIVSSAELPVSRLRFLTNSERSTLLKPDNLVTPLSGVCIHELFEEQVKKTPHSIAICYEDDNSEVLQVSYQELNQRANRLAKYLTNRGIRQDVKVCVCINRSVEMLVAVIATFKSGGVCIPLDPDFPEKRIVFMAKDGGAQFFISTTNIQMPLSLSKVEHIYLDQNNEDKCTDIVFTDKYQSNVNSFNSAYSTYTSGSTGNPKGVITTHEKAVNFLSAMLRCEPGIKQQDRMFALATLSFDLSIHELFLPLSCGACVCVANYHWVKNGEKIVDNLFKHDISMLVATPATWKAMLDSGWQGKSNLTALVGGEAISQELAINLISKTNSLWNMYGPTETTIWSSLHQLQLSHSTNTIKTTVIGRPIDNVKMFILDKHFELAPIGVAGELYIGGAGVSNGYGNNAILTAQKFIPNNLADKPGERLYATGDLVRLLTNGDYEFIGRADNQVKIRGIRIELGEIESGLRNLKEIKDAVVLALEDEFNDKRLVAYVVLTNRKVDIEKQIDTILRELKQLLPSYMLPSTFVELESFPTTATGKINRQALPAPNQEKHKDSYKPPLTETEAMLCEIWSRLLNCNRVGRDDNFFRLGGHSLLATQLVTRIEKQLLVEVKLNQAFENSTLKDMAAMIDQELKLNELNEDIISSMTDEEAEALLSELENG